ncbi:MAG: hypothetical protein HYV63_00035 [Candidatus Schekmanbacteria bacterium]|nr:hypothetical protein [Candidatus Schekmanbacteria bacterium]
MAVAHKILVIVHYLPLSGSIYEEHRHDRLQQEARRLGNAVKAIRSMGHDSQLQKAESPVAARA